MATRRKLAALGLVGITASLALTGCGGNEPAGSETKPLYGGELFDSRTVIGFESGEEMDCFSSESDAHGDSLICNWNQAPKANLRLKDEFKRDWTLVFLKIDGGTTVCLAKDWDGTANHISCDIDGIER